jgi:KDO2-lipid IV(A) lauroyltransferase
LHPSLTFIRKTIYLVFEKFVKLMGGYGNFERVFQVARLTGKLRFHIGYVGGSSKADYLTAIAKSFPELSSAEHQRILLEYWKDHQRMFLELFMFEEMNCDNIGRLVDFVGLEHLESALTAGKGAILPVPHIGNIRLLHYSLALKGYPVSVVSSGYSDDPEIVRRFKLSETSKAHEIGFRGEFPRWIVNSLKENRIVQIASTAEAGNVGVEVQFMNRNLFLTSGWVRLAVMSKTPILPTYILRGEGFRHTVHIEPPFPLSKGKNREEVIRKTTQAFLDMMEPIYRRHPHLIDWMSWMVRLREAERLEGL